MAVTTWLIDKSAYTRLAQSPDVQVWVDRIERGMVRMSTVTRLEIGYSFRTAAQARSESVSPPVALMPVEYLTPAVEDRAIEVQLVLADRGQHRALIHSRPSRSGYRRSSRFDNPGSGQGLRADSTNHGPTGRAAPFLACRTIQLN